MDKRRTMKYNCDGCGTKFDLLLYRFKQGQIWGKHNFYHTQKCARIKNKAWDGPPREQNASIDK